MMVSLLLLLGISITIWGSKVILKKISKTFNLICPNRIHFPAVFIILLLSFLDIALIMAHGNAIISLILVSLILKSALVLLFVVGISIVIDELWVREETKKTFNWFSLIDDLIISLSFVFFIAIGNMISSFQTTDVNKLMLSLWDFGQIDYLLPLTIGSITIIVGLAVLLEQDRPYIPFDKPINPEIPSDEVAEIRNALDKGQKTAFWDIQNPAFMDVLMIIVSIWLIAYGIASFRTSIFFACILLTVAVISALFIGGIRLLVNNDYLRINLGLLNLKMVEIPIYQIQEVSLYSYAPLREFGGYGVRFNGKMSAYYMRGNLGVLVKTTAGKQYLLGSDHPEKLLAVITAIKETKQLA